MAARREWYARLGHAIVEETPEYLMTDRAFRSEHFTEARLRGLVEDCLIRPCAGVGDFVTF